MKTMNAEMEEEYPFDSDSFTKAEELIHQLDLCYMLHDLLPPEQWEKERISAENILDSVALEDPELATYVHRKTSFFIETLPDGYVYIGKRIALTPEQKEIYNTPSKRAQYIAYLLAHTSQAHPIHLHLNADRSPKNPATPEDLRQPMQTRKE